MDQLDRTLTRVFVMARRTSEPDPAELPFGLETAVLAHWEDFRSPQVVPNILLKLRWAAILACAAALIGIAWERDELLQLSIRLDNETRIADSALLAGFEDE